MLKVARVGELQRKLNSQLQQVYSAKIRALLGSEWGSEVEDGDICVDALDNLKSLDFFAEVAYSPLQMNSFPSGQQTALSSKKKQMLTDRLMAASLCHQSPQRWLAYWVLEESSRDDKDRAHALAQWDGCHAPRLIQQVLLLNAADANPKPLICHLVASSLH